jgi:arylsulfatase A-like enzyme/Tfp pilus assembly protein PilF
LLALGIAVLLGTGTGCTDRPQAGTAKGADLVLITVDTLRADGVGYSGNARAETPLLDRLAAGGRVFTNAYSHSVMTLPSHANILTGRYPYGHGVRDNSGFALPSSTPTLASLLRDDGYRTGAFVAAFPLDSRFGLDQGFDVYDDRYPLSSRTKSALPAERSGSLVVESALDWWRAEAGHRRFLWLHLFEPHYPYAPPEPFASSFASNPYWGEIAATDSYLEPLLEPILAGEGNRPVVVVFTSDHGESLGEHGEEGHGLFAYQATLKVPMLLWGPGLTPGTDDRLVGHIDLLPTLLEILQIDSPTGERELPGRSLLASPAEPPEETRSLYFEALTMNLNLGWAPLRGLLTESEKFVDLPQPELYNLQEDPGETENLLLEHPERVRLYRRRLPAESPWPPVKGGTTLEAEARLRSLGYVGGQSRERGAWGLEDDPKSLVDLSRRIDKMLTVYSAGRLDEAAQLAREVLDQRPDTKMAYSILVDVLLDQGQVEKAIVLMRWSRERDLAADTLERKLALTLVQTGRFAEALSVLEPLVAPGTGITEPEDLAALGLALSGAGRQMEAADTVRRALEIDPEAPSVLEVASLVALRQARHADAEAFARKALERNENLAVSWDLLGLALYSTRRPDDALEAWSRSVAIDASRYEALFNLAVVALELGHPDIAKKNFEQFLRTAPAESYGEFLERAKRQLQKLQLSAGSDLD